MLGASIHDVGGADAVEDVVGAAGGVVGGEAAGHAEGDFGFDDAVGEVGAGEGAGGVDEHAVEEGCQDHVSVQDGGFPGDGGLWGACPAFGEDASAVVGGAGSVGVGDWCVGRAGVGGGVQVVGRGADLVVGEGVGHVGAPIGTYLRNVRVLS